MTNQTLQSGELIGGVDCHKDTVHVALITSTGGQVADHEFATDTAGYAAAIAWICSHGPIATVGVEGTSSYGLGIQTALGQAGIAVVEVNRTRAADRRKHGKSDPLDAYRAARAVLSGEATTAPKSPSIEPLRHAIIARRSAVKAQQAAGQQIGMILIGAPPAIRDTYRTSSTAALIPRLLKARPSAMKDPQAADCLTTLQLLAHRYQTLQAEIQTHTARLAAKTTAANPGLCAIKGVGPVTAAQLLLTAGNNPDRLRSPASFAALCGTAPVPASSGRVTRYRLSRGGDRSANWALHQILMNRLTWDQRTRHYRDRRLTEGKTTKEIHRCLKHAIARKIYRALTGHCDVPDYSDLRPARQAKNITLTAAANHLGQWPTTISRLERGQARNDDLATRYRTWLTAA